MPAGCSGAWYCSGDCHTEATQTQSVACVAKNQTRSITFFTQGAGAGGGGGAKEQVWTRRRLLQPRLPPHGSILPIVRPTPRSAPPACPERGGQAEFGSRMGHTQHQWARPPPIGPCVACTEKQPLNFGSGPQYGPVAVPALGPGHRSTMVVARDALEGGEVNPPPLQGAQPLFP